MKVRSLHMVLQGMLWSPAAPLAEGMECWLSTVADGSTWEQLLCWRAGMLCTGTSKNPPGAGHRRVQGEDVNNNLEEKGEG